MGNVKLSETECKDGQKRQPYIWSGRAPSVVFVRLDKPAVEPFYWAIPYFVSRYAYGVLGKIPYQKVNYVASPNVTGGEIGDHPTHYNFQVTTDKPDVFKRRIEKRPGVVKACKSCYAPLLG